MTTKDTAGRMARIRNYWSMAGRMSDSAVRSDVSFLLAEVDRLTAAVEEAHRAGRVAASEAIVAHADKHAPAGGSLALIRLRRHLMIAAQVAAPKPTKEEIFEAFAAVTAGWPPDIIEGER